MLGPTPSLDLLRSQTLAGAVEEDIIRRIKAGAIMAGAKLNEADLAESMQISRAPVREAFRSLETAGLVRLEKNRGVYIRDITDEEAAELYAVRRGLDEMAGRLLAPGFTDRQAGELAAMLEELEAASLSGEVDRYFPLNIAFHDRVVEMAGNRTLLGFYRQVIDRMHLLRRRGFETDSSSAASHREHLAILRALRLRDAEAASRAMGQHVSNGFERTLGAKQAAGGEPATAAVAGGTPRGTRREHRAAAKE